MIQNPPLSGHLVLVGGGHAHVQILKSLAMRPIQGLLTTLISREALAPYSGMLPGIVAGFYDIPETHFDLRTLCVKAGIRFIQGQVDHLDPVAREARVTGRPSLSYDWCSIDVGIQPRIPSGFVMSPRVIPVKPISGFLGRWEALLALARSQPDSKGRIAFVGGGAAGVELSLIASRKIHELAPDTEIHLFHSGDRLLPGHSARAGAKALNHLRRTGVSVHLDSEVLSLSGEGDIVTSAGEAGRFGGVMLTTDAAAPSWFGSSGLAVDGEGFLLVNRELRSTGDERIFGAGDCISIEGVHLPKSGVYAVREGATLDHNLRAAILGRPARHFHPQRKTLALITTGDRNVIASRGKLTLEGRWLWKIKDSIDRRFMKKFSHEFPDESSGSMSRKSDLLPTQTRSTMLCGGCGSKIGALPLRRALIAARISGPADRDPEPRFRDASELKFPAGSTLLQSVDYFERLIDDPYLFGWIAANHAMSDLHAAGAKPVSALAVAMVPRGNPERVSEDLAHLLKGALETLRPEGAEIAGGHSIQGDHLGFGLAVTGTSGDPGFSKQAPNPGEALILTKALGTGTLLAAHHQGRGWGPDTWGAIQSMCRSNASAAAVLIRHQIRSCTDVTGFGLLGHLLELLNSGSEPAEAARIHSGFEPDGRIVVFGSSRRVVLDPAAVPFLPGALARIEEGVESSMVMENNRFLARVELGSRAASDARIRLLADPQTAGGLLAFVPADRASKIVSELHSAGDSSAAVIGAAL